MSAHQHPTHDLLLIPQAGTRIPADHLTPDEADQAWHDWTTTTNTPIEGQPTWTIATAHATPHGLSITSTITIPRQGATTPVAQNGEARSPESALLSALDQRKIAPADD